MRVFSLCLPMYLMCSGVALAAAWQRAPADSAQRIYVEPFATQQSSEKLRENVIAELRKVNSLAVATDASSATAILGGGGEIWIKGYRSHNPQLGDVPGNGTPVFSGFLSVELKNSKGESLWSYLATAPAASRDVSKDIAKEIATNLAEFLEHGAVPVRVPSLPQPAITLKGAGSTFVFPVYEKWFTNYRRENPSVEITYDSIGSEAGVRRLLAHSVDFGASDSPEAIHELAPGNEKNYLFLPSLVGAVVPIVNLPAIQGDIAFTPEALAGIYLGTIKKWNDPILTRANPKNHLPDLPIIVAHRADGSGTSYVWTDYLSETSSAWKTQVGRSLTPHWPIGREATGNDGVAKLVKDLPGAIGYVEFIYALQNHLPYGRVKNRKGEFVAASLESLAAATSHIPGIKDDFNISIVDPPGAGAYPITSFSWIVVPVEIGDESKRNAIAGFLNWMLGPGQRQAAALGYLPLPQEVVAREATIVKTMH